jgi:hypothetical protein
VPTVETELKTLPGVGAALGKLLSIVNVTARCDAASSATNSSSSSSMNSSSNSSSKSGSSNPYGTQTVGATDITNSSSHSSKDNRSSSKNSSSSSSSSSSVKQLDASTVDTQNTGGSVMGAAAADAVDISKKLCEAVCKDVYATADTDNNAADTVLINSAIGEVVQPVEQYVDSDCIAASSSSSGECYSATQIDATQIDATQIDVTQIHATQTQCIEDG